MEDDFLQYGDIIHINSKNGHNLNDKSFLIDYIDNKHIRVINSTDTHIIYLETDGTFSDTEITQIVKISSPTEKGFAIQNNITPGKWVIIKFNVDMPDISGMITNLEKDRIEIKIIDDEEPILIYIDFEYKGLPSYVKNITVSGVPTNGIQHQEVELAQYLIQDVVIDDKVEHLYDGLDIKNELKTLYLNSNDLIFSNEIEKVVLRLEKDERYKIHSIDAQITDIVDSLLSTVPNHKRTQDVLSDVHLLVERFVQLRNKFSKKDEHGTVVCPLLNGKNNKPLASLLCDASFNRPKWILPVISKKRKIYTTPQAQDQEILLNQDNVLLENISSSIGSHYELQRRYYRGKNTNYGYVEHINDIDKLMTPYTKNDDYDNTIISNQVVNHDQDTIMFDTTTWNKTNIWNTGNNLIQRIATSGPFIENDTIDIQSIVMLPEIVNESSKISLNNLNIMTRSSMNKSYFPLSNVFSINKTSFSKKIIDNYEEINYEANKLGKICHINRPRVKHMNDTQLLEHKIKRKEQKFDSTDFLKGIINYEIDVNSSITDDTEKYEKFLYTIIPSTYDLLKLSSSNKHMTKNFSFLEFVHKFLEPYMIYTNDIHFDEGYSFIRFAIKKSIDEYKVKILVDGKKNRRKILELNKKNVIVYNKNNIEEIVQSKQQIYDKSYFNDDIKMFTQLSTSEMLANMFHIDGANMMTNIIFAKNQHLIVNPEFVEEVLQTVTNPNEKCSRNFIAKRYKSLSELEDDNGKEMLYYDVELDDTPYEILELYKKERSKDNFDIFLRKMLIEKHSCPVNASSELAETIIRGKKLIVNDEYASLQNDETQVFYKRKQSANKWILDRTVKPSFFINNNELFCNMNNKCIKNDKTKTCDGITEHKNLYVNEFKTRLDELDKRIIIDNENESQKLLDLIKRNNNLKYIQSYRQNILAVELAKDVLIDNTHRSPFIALRDNILGHRNFSEKQDYIIKFVELYTRKPIISEPVNGEIKENESPYWLYCTKSNSKLLPKFLFELANAFYDGSYQEKMSQICGDFGDTDGQGTYFDKNSGYTISKMDLINVEEYSEGGSIISSHSIIDNSNENVERNFFHRSTNNIDTIFHAICFKLDIRYKENEFHNFVMKNATEMIDLIEDEDSYKKKLSIIKKRDTKIIPLPYDVFVNQNLIYIISSLIFILIQTAIPPIKKVKTFEECVQSFSGFPLTTSDEDESGIKYLSCVILKLKSSILPWNGIMNIRENVFKENLKRKLIALLLRKDIKDMYEKKKLDSESISKINTQPQNNNITKWIYVLPPIVNFTVKNSITNVTGEFHNELTKLIKSGHKDQHKYIGIIRSKIISYGYAIIESINDVVKRKELTLKTTSNTPYKQNSCCNDNKIRSSTLQFFNNEDNKITNYISNSLKCELILSDIRKLSTASLFFYKNDTRYKKISDETFSLQYRDNVIGTFIHYLKYDTLHPVPFAFKKKYTKPVKYDSKMSFDKKIEILESDKTNYDINAFDNLLKIVNAKNMVNINDIIEPNSVEYDEMNQFKNFIDLKLNNVNVEDIVQGSFTDVLHNFATTSLNDFKIFIGTTNEIMKDELMQNVGLLNFNQNETNIWLGKLINMTDVSNWNIYKEDTNNLNTILKFVKNAIFKMCKVYPSFIRNNVTEHFEIKKRWGLSDKHLGDLSNFKNQHTFKYLNKFHSKDDIQIFSGDLTELDDIIQLSNNIPHSNKSDIHVCESLLTYTWLSVFRVFIDSVSNFSNDDKFIDGDKNFFKRRMIELLTTFLEMESINKTHTDISLFQIQQNSFKFRQVEKKMITDTLKELNSDGRKMMSQMKKIGLGIWREGKVGLVKYDPKAYDRNGVKMIETDENNEEDDINLSDEYPVEEQVETGYDSGDGDGNNNNNDDDDM